MGYQAVLGQLNLAVRDMDAAVAFYRSLRGVQRLRRIGQQVAR